MSEINRWSLRCESVTNDDATHRYILRIEWNKEKPKATVILIQPASAIPVELDMTTMNIINNLNRLDYGGCDIVNLFSLVCNKVSMKYGMGELVREENIGYIQRSCLKSDVVIIAYGSVGEGVRKIMDYQQELIHEKLEPFKDKMYIICDPYIDKGLHPLCPRIKHSWRLVKLFNK